MAGSTTIGPVRVLLDLEAPAREEAVRATADLLRQDARVGGWDEFWSSIGGRQIVDLEGSQGGVILAHGRGGSVEQLALAAARWNSPHGPRLVFVFAIPSAMTAEYLRKVGALARVCREPAKLDALLAAATPEEFGSKITEWIG
jgi:mannitol/fructose-specific phosphotransferase system IIA component (Ntr-type)